MNYRQIHDTIIERAKIRKIEGYKESWVLRKQNKNL